MEVSDKLKKLLSLKKRRKKFHSSEEEDTDLNKLDQFLATSCRRFFSQRIEFHCVELSDSHLEHLKSRYSPLNRTLPHSSAAKVKMDSNSLESNSEGPQSESSSGSSHSDELPQPKRDIFDSKSLIMEWKSSKGVGAGLGNLGNTCFLNSVLQCLLYTPPLYNYLTSVDHKQKCEESYLQWKSVILSCVIMPTPKQVRPKDSA